VLAGCLTETGKAQWVGKKNVVPFLLDLTSKESINNAYELVAKNTAESGGLWGIVNNAGTSKGMLFELTDPQKYKDLMEINFFGHVALTYKLLPFLKQARGRIVNMSSLAVLMAAPGLSNYCSTKFAMHGWSHAIRLELKAYGISVSVLHPGFMKTPLVTMATFRKEKEDVERTFSAEHLKTFALYFKAAEERFKQTEANAGNPQSVVDCYVHALLALRPRPKYVVGRDAQIFTIMALIFPRWIWEKLLPVPQLVLDKSSGNAKQKTN